MNPIEKVTYHRIAPQAGFRPDPERQAGPGLMTYVEGYRGGALVPFFALCLFAGIRPCLRTG